MMAALPAVVSRGSAQPNPVLSPQHVLSGAQAFIGPDEARFVFPRQVNDSYEWDVPIPGVSGGAGYMWEVSWEVPDNRKGIDPAALWLIQWWKSGGPRKGSLTQLIEWLKLEPMIESNTRIGRLDRDRRKDYKNVLATVENGQLVFIVRGAEAVQRIFPTVPSRVTFGASLPYKTPPRDFGVLTFRRSQTVIVNCRNSDESPGAKNRCDVAP